MADSKTNIKQRVKELRESNAVLQKENEVFKSFLRRSDSLNLLSQPAEFKEEPKNAETSQKPSDLLTQEQKYYIAMCELNEMKKEQKQENFRSVTNDDRYYKALIKASDMRLAEIKRERSSFERFVAKAHETQDLPLRAKMITGYIENKTKATESRIERMERRNTLLQAQIQKQQQQDMVQKKKPIQVKCMTTLDQLKEMNIQYHKTLPKLKKQVLYKRMEVLRSKQNLKAFKEQLRNELKDSELLSREIASYEEKLLNIRNKNLKIEKERAQAEALNKSLNAHLDDFPVLDVMKYMEAKATNDGLKLTIKTLERKARIAELAAKAEEKIVKEQ